MGCKNWVATEVSRPRDSGGPGWPQRRVLESLDQLQRLHDRALAVGEAQAAGEGGADSASPSPTPPRPGFDDQSSDEEWLLSSLDSWGRVRCGCTPQLGLAMQCRRRAAADARAWPCFRSAPGRL